jgi:hypothetical protein
MTIDERTVGGLNEAVWGRGTMVGMEELHGLGTFWMKGGGQPNGQRWVGGGGGRWQARQQSRADFRGRVFGGEGGGAVRGGTDVGIRSDWKG